MANENWNFKLNSFHNKLFRQFKIVKQQTADGELLETLLNWLYYDNILTYSNENISGLLLNVVTEEKKEMIRNLLTQHGLFFNKTATTMKQQGDISEQAVALLGQMLANIDENDLNLKLGVTGDYTRVLELPEELSSQIIKNMASKITSEKVGKNKTGFIYTSPGQMKVDVDYQKLLIIGTIDNDNSLITRLLKYRFSVKAYTSNLIHLEEINWQQALISILSTIYSTRTAHKIALWYNHKIASGEIWSNDELGKHVDHVVKLQALTGYGGFEVNTSAQLQRVATILPDFLVINQIAQQHFYVIPINAILAELESSVKTITERASRYTNVVVSYNIGTNTLRYN